MQRRAGDLIIRLESEFEAMLHIEDLHSGNLGILSCK